MTSKHKFRYLALGAMLIALGGAVSATALDQRGGAIVNVGTTGDNSELEEFLPITDNPGDVKRVVMVLTDDAGFEGGRFTQLPPLSGGDDLQIPVELMVTTDCTTAMAQNPNNSCYGDPYNYNPEVRMRPLLADSPTKEDNGTGAIWLDPVLSKGCSHNEHHCTLTTNFVEDLPQNLPCSPGDCYVNIVADANDDDASGSGPSWPDKVLVGGNDPEDDVHPSQDKGRLSAVRKRGAVGGDDTFATTTSAEESSSIPTVDPQQDVVVYSESIGQALPPNDHLEDDNQIYVKDTSVVVENTNNQPAAFGLEVIVTCSDSDTTVCNRADNVIADPYITEQNGENVLASTSSKTRSKTGVARVKEDADENDPHLRVNVIANSGEPFGAIGNIGIKTGGQLKVVVYPPELEG